MEKEKEEIAVDWPLQKACTKVEAPRKFSGQLMWVELPSLWSYRVVSSGGSDTGGFKVDMAKFVLGGETSPTDFAEVDLLFS